MFTLLMKGNVHKNRSCDEYRFFVLASDGKLQ